MSDFTGQAIDNILLSKISDKIGTVRQSMLGETEFNNDNPGNWVLMDGRSCAGTEYETLTLNSNVPDMVAQGAFMRQKNGGRVEGDYQDMDWKGFYQMNTGQNTPSYNHNSEYHGKSTTSFVGRTFAGYWAANSAATGTKWDTSEVRPKNIAINHYIKIGY